MPNKTEIQTTVEELTAQYKKVKTLYDKQKEVVDASQRKLNEVQARLDDLRDQVREAVYPLGPGTKVHTKHALVELMEGRTSVEIVDINLLPEGFYEIVKQAKKANILTHWRKTGDQVDGSRIVIGEPFVRITV